MVRLARLVLVGRAFHFAHERTGRVLQVADDMADLTRQLGQALGSEEDERDRSGDREVGD